MSTNSESDVSRKIVVEGERFVFLKQRDHSPILVFEGERSFLRMGPKDLIAAELEKHRLLTSLGYPLPEILLEGEINGQYFYQEESLGNKHFAILFAEDYEKDGGISKERFRSFLEISAKFVKAQLRSPQESYNRDQESFYSGINMDYILEELPKLRRELTKTFEMIKEKTGGLPMVLSHGDMNPYNLFPKGIIDVGNVLQAPAGYDVVSNIYNVNNFPKEGDYEVSKKFDFSPGQRSQYFDRMDKVFLQSGSPGVSGFVEEFIISRAIWSTARMQRFPKLQQWRYYRLTHLVNEYLSGGSVTDVFLKDSE